MSRGFWSFKDIGKSGLRFCRSKGAKLLLGAGLCVAGPFTVEAEDTSREIPVSAIEACVPENAETIRVSWQPEEELFRDASGARYLASETRSPVAWRSSAAAEGFGNNPEVFFEAVPFAPANRWGIIPAWIIVNTGTERRLLQFEDLERGNGLFAPGHSTADCARFLRHAEAGARKRKLGIWGAGTGTGIYPANAPEELEKVAGEYVIAQGRIVSLGKTRSTRYLNFGKYWKTDFTVTFRTSDEESFNNALVHSGWKVDALAGQVVELRGVVQLKDGPTIKLSHPGQLLVVESKRAGRGSQDNN